MSEAVRCINCKHSEWRKDKSRTDCIPKLFCACPTSHWGQGSLCPDSTFCELYEPTDVYLEHELKIKQLTAERDRLRQTIDEIKDKIASGYINQLAFVGDGPVFLKERPVDTTAERDALKAENERLRKALELIKNMSGVGSHFLAALKQIREVSTAALKGE